MTDLQTSLIAIGGGIVVTVFFYNKWQEYRTRKRVQRAFAALHDDVLMSSEQTAERQEPVLVSAPQYEKSGDSAAPLDLEAAQQEMRLPVDEHIDCVIPLALEGTVQSESVLPLAQSLRYVGNKPVNFIGQRDDNDLWEALTPGSVYGALKAGVQLANRHSTLNELEYSECVTRLRAIADTLDAESSVPDMPLVMANAHKLFQFIKEYGAQLSVNILSNSAPWAVNTLLTALERQGFELRTDGHLTMLDGEGGVLFSLSTNVTLAVATTSRLTLLLDVACVKPERNGFGAMIDCAKMLSTRLEGSIVDDSNQLLSDEALAEIAQQVSAFYTDMQTAGVPAGSLRALRLFK